MNEPIDRKSMGTGYRLSISSNPGSRRSSIAGEHLYSTSVLNSSDNNNIGNGNGNNGMIDGIDADGNEYHVLQKYLLPQINDLHDSVITLEGNFARINNIHNNLVDINESFGSLLYGMIVNSACIHFPNMPYNIPQELETAKKLRSLREEKRKLKEEISSRKIQPVPNNNIGQPNLQKSNRTRVGSGPNKSNNKFSQPLYPISQTKRISNRNNSNMTRLAQNNGRLQHSKTNNLNNNRKEHFVNKPHDEGFAKNNDEEGYIDDDNSSEASFVLNPTNLDIKSALNQPTLSSSARGASTAMNRKYRRKSIMNVIRNSIDPNEQRVRSVSSLNESDLNQSTISGRATRVSHSKNTTADRIIPSKRVHKTVTRPKSTIDKRPPFR